MPALMMTPISPGDVCKALNRLKNTSRRRVVTGLGVPYNPPNYRQPGNNPGAGDILNAMEQSGRRPLGPGRQGAVGLRPQSPGPTPPDLEEILDAARTNCGAICPAAISVAVALR